jgi:hypothetical protein
LEKGIEFKRHILKECTLCSEKVLGFCRDQLDEHDI